MKKTNKYTPASERVLQKRVFELEYALIKEKEKNKKMRRGIVSVQEKIRKIKYWEGWVAAPAKEIELRIRAVCKDVGDMDYINSLLVED